MSATNQGQNVNNYDIACIALRRTMEHISRTPVFTRQILRMYAYAINTILGTLMETEWYPNSDVQERVLECWTLLSYGNTVALEYTDPLTNPDLLDHDELLNHARQTFFEIVYAGIRSQYDDDVPDPHNPFNPNIHTGHVCD